MHRRCGGFHCPAISEPVLPPVYREIARWKPSPRALFSGLAASKRSILVRAGSKVWNGTLVRWCAARPESDCRCCAISAKARWRHGDPDETRNPQHARCVAAGLAAVVLADAQCARLLLFRGRLLLRLSLRDVVQPGDRFAVLVSRLRTALRPVVHAGTMVAAADSRHDSDPALLRGGNRRAVQPAGGHDSQRL